MTPYTNDAALQRFLDAELPDDQAAALAAQLREDASLRARLEAMRAQDEAIAASLVSPSTPPRRRIATGRIALAASILLAAAVSPLFLTISEDPLPAPRPDPMTGMLIAVRTAPDAPARTTETPSESVPDPAILARLDAALAQRRPADAVGLIVEAGQAPELWAALGERIRSGSTAQDALDALPPETQLAVCEVWAHRNTLRPIAFDRIRALSRDPELAQRIDETRARLAQNPDLAPWLSSYAQR